MPKSKSPTQLTPTTDSKSVRTELVEPPPPDGNTKSSGGGGADAPPKYSAVRWEITIDVHPCEAGKESELVEPIEPKIKPFQIHEVLRTFCDEYYFVLERGEKSGRYHYHCAVHTKQRLYWTQVKECAGIPWAHVAPPHKGWFALKNYCTQVVDNPTLVGGPWDHINQPGMKFHVLRPQVLEDPAKGWESFRPFQQEILDMIARPPEKRVIHWYWEPDGNMGKSEFVKHVLINYPDVLLVGGKARDAKNSVVNHTKKKGRWPEIIFWDIVRKPDSQEYISWEALESIKNGMFSNEKYESGMHIQNQPWVFVFSNFDPTPYNDGTILSKDRLIIHRV